MKKTKFSIFQTANVFFITVVMFFFSSCQHVFVWTVKDVIGLSFIGLLILTGLVFGLVFLFDKIKIWWAGLFKQNK